MKIDRRLSAVLALLFFCQVAAPSVLAQQAPSEPANLDMGSTQRSIVAGSVANFQPTNLREGQINRQISSTTLLTPAESLALGQVLAGGQQQLQLHTTGNAKGGSVNITSQLGIDIANLVVPKGVSAFGDFGAGSNLNVLGNITNSGNLFALSTNAAVTDAIFSGTNIINKQGAVISSILPAGAFGITGAIPGLNLTLNAIQDVINQGTVAAAGSLFVNAGGSIVNALPAGAAGPSPVMQAMGNINLMSTLGSITNSGVISALTGNVNVLAANANNISFNNVGGVVSAATGNINFRDLLFDAKANLNLSGGDWLSKELNLFSGTGNIDVAVGEISGIVNASSHNFHIAADTQTLQLGTINVAGDPIFLSTGDIDISVPISTSGAPLAYIAGGTIRTTAPGISLDTTGTGANPGGDITIIAGADFINDIGSNQIRVLGPSTSGGNINFNGANPISDISALGGPSGGDGGTVQMAAFNGVLGGGVIDCGGLIQTQATAGFTSGNVTIIAGAVRGHTGTTSTVGLNVLSINAGANGSPGGTIRLVTATPSFSNAFGTPANHVCNNCFILESATGAVPGQRVGNSSLSWGNLQKMDIVASNSLSTTSGFVYINAGDSAALESISTTFNSGNAGAVEIHTGGTIPMLIGGGGSQRNHINHIFAQPLLSGTTGGSISINTGSAPIEVIDGFQLFVLSNGVATTLHAGSIELHTTGLLTLTGGDLIVSGNSSGAGNSGQLTIYADRIITSAPYFLSGQGGSGGGNAGVLNLTQLTSKQELVFNTSGANSLFVNFSANSSLGNGGTATINSGSNIKALHPGALNLAGSTTDGDGGKLFLSTATSPQGTILVDYSLDLSGHGTGNGGIVNINQGGKNTFSVANSLGTAGGVKGSIKVDAGTAGNGGTIVLNSQGPINLVTSLSAKGATGGASTGGSITVNAKDTLSLANPANVDVSSLGSGGSIILKSTGTMTVITDGTLRADGSATGSFDGGTVTVEAKNFDLSGLSSPLALSAKGSDAGSGGIVTISQTGVVGTGFNIQSSAGSFTVNAQSGATGGSGGSAIIRSGGSLIIDPSAITITPQGTDGDGGSYTFEAGSASSTAPGELRVTGSIDASANGNADGGSVTLTARTGDTLEIASTTGQSFIQGQILANVSGTGTGGKVSITNNSRTGITLASADVDVTTANGSGGELFFSAPQGTVTLQNSGPGFDVAAHGAVNGNGGKFTVLAGDLIMPVQPVNIEASGNLTGDGGQISITQTIGKQNNGNLTVALSALDLEATSGASGGNGGSITVSTPGALTVLAAGAAAGPLGTNGNGASYTFKSGTNHPGLLTVNSLNASGVGTGNGGSIVLESGGSGTFDIGSIGSGGGVLTSLIAAGGGTAGKGGAITIKHAGTLLTLNDPGDISVFAGNGDGGSISLSAPKGLLQIDTQSTAVLDVSAHGAAGANGGSINLSANSLFIGLAPAPAPMPLQLLAKGTNSGDGGTVAITTTNRNNDLSFNGSFGSMTINASSGLGTNGNGGTVDIHAGGSLNTLDSSITAAVAATNGNGGSVTLVAGNDLQVVGGSGIQVPGVGTGHGGDIFVSAESNLTIVGTLNASGGTGTLDMLDAYGGTIIVFANTALPFGVGDNSTPVGVQGQMQVSGGAVSGYGGGIFVSNFGTGGLRVNGGAFATAVAQGNGATIQLDAPKGLINFTAGSLIDASAGPAAYSGFAGCCHGGHISVEGRSIVTTGGNLQFKVFGSTSAFNGDGGTVRIHANSPGSQLIFGIDANMFQVLAASVNTIGTGNGGTFDAKAGTISISTNSVMTDVGQNNGNGGIWVLQATAPGIGFVSINGAVNLSGSGYGNGGTLDLTVNTAAPFLINNDALLLTFGNGIKGSIQTNAGFGSGSGGFVTIKNLGSGGIRITDGALIESKATGAHASGNVFISAGAGPLVIGNSIVDVSNDVFDAGSIVIEAGSLSKGPNATAGLILDADGARHGGSVSVTLSATLSDLTVGNQAGQIQIQANGGEVIGPDPVTRGNAGAVTLSVKRNLTINTVFLGVSPTNAHGNGGIVSLSADGNLFVNGNLNMDGTGIGDGGAVIVNATGATKFGIGPATTISGIAGFVSANAGGEGSGGTIKISVPKGTLSVLHDTQFNANAAGTGTNEAYNGGTIEITAISMIPVGTGAAFGLNALSAANGNGGTVKLTLSNGDINVGSVLATQFKIDVRGGSVGGTAGNGGTIALTSGKSVLVNDSASFQSRSRSGNGNGAKITLKAAANLLVNAGTQDARGGGIFTNGTGDGGEFHVIKTGTGGGLILLGLPGASSVNGNIFATGGAGGGSGGIIEVDGANAIVRINGGFSAQAGGTLSNTGEATNGGSITIKGISVETLPGSGLINLGADGFGAGNGGTIKILATGKSVLDLKVGVAAGNFVISATGGSTGSIAGDGGHVELLTKNLIMQAGNLAVFPKGDAGAGGTIVINAAKLMVNGQVNVGAGVSFGTGGSVTLNSNSTLTFDINTGVPATGNGLTGDITASGGSIFGNGGTINIGNAGAGGITYGNGGTPPEFFVTGSGLGAKSGTIALTSALGPLVLNNGAGFNANGSTAHGGSILVNVKALTIGAGTAPHLDAESNFGNGGLVSVITSLATNDIVLGGASGQLLVQARGGLFAPAFANGGAVSITAGRSLTVQTLGFNAGTAADNGDGASVTLASGNGSTTGLLLVKNGIFLDAEGFGNGGNLTLQAKTPVRFVLNGGAGTTTNGVEGLITLTGGTGGGSGGNLTINVLAPARTLLGGISLPAGQSITVANVSPFGNAGNITLNAVLAPLVLTNASLGSPVVLSTAATANSQGNGGALQISADTIVYTTPAASRATLTSDGQSAGLIKVTTAFTTLDADISIGSGAKSFDITGQSNNTLQGNPATVEIVSGRNVTVDPVSLNVAAFSFLSPGANVTLKAGVAAAKGLGNLLINGTLSVNGGSVGQGGTLTLQQTSATKFLFSPTATVSGVTGLLTARGGTLSGNGGTVVVNASGNAAGGIQAANTLNSNIDVDPFSGKGGNISLIATGGSFVFTAQNFVLLGDDAGISDDGGNLMISAGTLVAGLNSPSLNSFGTGLGKGGNVSLVSTGTGSINLGGGAGAFKLQSLGGLAGAPLGVSSFSGTLSASSGGSITADLANSILTGNVPLDSTVVNLTAGTATTGNITITGTNFTAGRGPGSALNLTTTKGFITAPIGVELRANSVKLIASGAIGTSIFNTVNVASGDRLTGPWAGGVSVTSTAGSAFLQLNASANNGDTGLLLQSGAAVNFTVTSTQNIGSPSQIGRTTIAGPLSAASVKVVSLDNDIIALANITGTGKSGIVELSANSISNPNSYFQVDGIVTAGTVKFNSSNGNIGMLTAPAFTTANALTLHAIDFGNGNAYVTNTLPVALNSSSCTGDLFIKANGNISLLAPVTGIKTFSVTTLFGSKGNVTLTNSLQGGKEIFVNADNAIIAGKGFAIADHVSLTAGIGGITGGLLLFVGDNTNGGGSALVDIHTTGNATVSNLSLFVRLQQSFVGGNLTFTSFGDVFIDQSISSNGNITIQTAKSLDPLATGKITISNDLLANPVTGTIKLSTIANNNISHTFGQLLAQKVTLSSVSGDIGALGGSAPIPIQAAFASVNTLGSAVLTAATSTTILASKTGGDFTITGGDSLKFNTVTASHIVVPDAQEIQVLPAAILTGTNGINLTVTGPLGMTFNGNLLTTNVGAGSAPITIASAGPIVQGTGKLISSVASPINITTAAGNNITLNGSTMVKTGAGMLTVVSGGALSVFGASTANDHMILTATTGALNILPLGKISAKEGEIQINNLDVTTGTITFGSGSSITGLSKVPGKGALGRISAFIGATAPMPPFTDGTFTGPGTLTLVEVGVNGQIIFGTNGPAGGITVTGTANKASAINQMLIFDTNSSALGAAAIQVTSKVTFLADPPAATTVGAAAHAGSPAGARVLAPTLDVTDVVGTRSSGTGPSVLNGLPSLSTPFFPMPFFSAPSAPLPSTGHGDSATGTGESAKTGTADNTGHLQPVAFVPATQTFQASTSVPVFTATQLTSATVKHRITDKVAATAGNALAIEHGEAVVSARKSTTITAGGYAIVVPSGTAVQVSHKAGVTTVRTLFDVSGKAVHLLVAGHSLALPAGHEVICSDNVGAARQAAADGMGRRKVEGLMIDGKHAIVHSQFALVTLVRKNDILSNIAQSQHATDRSITERILKMAACLMQVTSSHGAYTTVDLERVPLKSVTTPAQSKDKSNKRA